jgi:hypothetical protein
VIDDHSGVVIGRPPTGWLQGFRVSRLAVCACQAPAHRLARQPFVLRQPDHRANQKIERPALASLGRRVSSLSASSGLASTERRLVRYTVDPSTENAARDGFITVSGAGSQQDLGVL